MSPRERIPHPRTLFSNSLPELPRLYHSSLIRQGGSHRADGRNCQDYAVTAECEQGTVLVVTDGASRYHDEQGFKVPSFNEAAAVLVGELAARAAIEGLRSTKFPDAIRDLVAHLLHASLAPLWSTLGEVRGRRILGCTLLLGIVTESWTRIYVSGDGSWGVHLAPDVNTDSLVGKGLVVAERGGIVSARGTLHTPKLGAIASMEARTSPEAVIEALPLALAVDAPVLGAWVSTDGLRDEPAVQRLIQAKPLVSSTVLREALEAPAHGDDLALAWASDRIASLLLDTAAPVARPNGLASEGGAHA